METNISKPTACFMIVAFLAVISSVFVFELTSGTYGELLEAHPPRVETLLDGSFARATDDYLRVNSATMRASRPRWNGVMLRCFSETPPEVSVGREGYMFLNAGLRPMIEEESFKAWDQTMGMLEDLARTIQPSGAKLRVVVMPSKWRLHEEKLRGRGPGPDRRDLYSKVIQGLAERSIDAPNVLDLLKAYRRAHKGDQLFSPCDTHFSRLGFRVVTAEAIAGLMGISPNAAKGRMSRLPRVASSYHGDLLDLMSLGADSAVGRRFAYEEESLIVPPCFNQKGARVLVFGDSFVEAYNGLLPGLIQAATGLTVDARYALWSPANQAALFKDYAAQPAHFVVMALTERLFGSQ